MITNARRPRWRIRRSFSSASQSGQPSELAALRYSIRQGAHSGCEASGVGPRLPSAMAQLLAEVVLHAVAEVVQLAGGAVSHIPQALVEAVGGLETGVGPQFHGGGLASRCLGLYKVDQFATQPYSSRRAGDV